MVYQQQVCIISFFFFYFLGCFFVPLFSKPVKLFNSVKILHIKSVKQRMLDKNRVIFEGEVEVLVDHSLHVWADMVEVDKQKKLLIAQQVDGGPVKIENNDLLVLADTFTLNLTEKTGFAENIRIHVKEGFLYAARAEKLTENRWSMKNIVYTSCDAQHMHWHLWARKAVVQGGYFIRVKGVLFKIGSVPIFGLPTMAFPIQGRSRSGFLIPKFYYDYDHGLGAKLEYYHYFGPRCDTTFGVAWREKKGIFMSDEFRWARSPSSFTHANAHFAVAKNSFSKKGDQIVHVTKNRYWIAGKDFNNTNNFLDGHISSLIRVDYGTDKRIEYQFFSDIEHVDDEFCNSWILRGLWPQNQLQILAESTKTSRKRFSELSESEKKLFEGFASCLEHDDRCVSTPLIQKKELENRVIVTKIPHVEWNKAFTFINSNLSYRHDLMVDYIDFRELESERFYFNSMLEREERLVPLNKANLLRWDYQGTFEFQTYFKNHYLRLFCNPVLQVRSTIKQPCFLRKRVIEDKILSRGSARVFAHYGAELSFPEVLLSNSSGHYIHYLQPTFSWNYTPRFFQDHWFFIDRWDRHFARNELSFSLRSNWIFDACCVDLYLRQGYDFNQPQNIFPLKRPTLSTHVLPFEWEASLSWNNLQMLIGQEYDVKAERLIQSQFLTTYMTEKFSLGFGYLYQHCLLQKKRCLLSNIPHFFLFNATIPFSKYLSLHYDGQFYSESGQHFLGFSNIKPLIHSVRLDYNGHCWGFYIGYEEKRYREHGVSKGERAFIFSLRLDSLGSFAKRFRKPQFLRN